MRHHLVRAIFAAALSSGCAGGDIDAPSARDPSNPRAPEAPFDAGASPLRRDLPPPPPVTPGHSGHHHG
jgi:hypothetical protein